MAIANSTIFSKVNRYLKLRRELLAHLSKHPDDWRKFQGTFNSKLDLISMDILQFERENISNESMIYRFKRIFEKRYRYYFLHGEYPKWSYEKPFGYAGDFKIIDDIYRNQPRTVGFDGLWDYYYQQMTASRATRMRKEDIKNIITDFIRNHKNQDIRIMNLGSGPAREIKELLETDSKKIFLRVIFDCYDFDARAIDYAKKLVNEARNVNFLQKNIIRIALKKEVKEEIPEDYDLIYSVGLFDYLDEKIAVRLVINLKKLLRKNGMLVIANFDGKYNNSSAGLMEWATEWYLIYRNQDELKKIFINAGFLPKNLQITPQANKLIFYCLANNR